MTPNITQIFLNALPALWNGFVGFWIQLLTNPAAVWPIVGILAMVVLTWLAPTAPRRRRRRRA